MSNLAGLPFDLAEVRTGVALVAIGVARATGLLLITPFLGKGVLTGLARNGVILALSLPLLKYGYSTRPPDFDATNLFLTMALVLKELAIGVLLGMPVATVAWGIEAAGFFVDNQRGSTMASSLNPMSGNQTSPVGMLLGQAYTTWMFITGGFLLMLRALYESARIWPVWQFIPAFAPGFGGAMLRVLDTVMMLAVLIAGPAIIAMFLTEFGLALTSRFAPQLQVFFMAMPLKSAVGLLILTLSMGLLLGEAGHYLPSATDTVRAVTGLLR
jgi:type III secretion protein T